MITKTKVKEQKEDINYEQALDLLKSLDKNAKVEFKYSLDFKIKLDLISRDCVFSPDECSEFIESKMKPSYYYGTMGNLRKIETNKGLLNKLYLEYYEMPTGTEIPAPRLLQVQLEYGTDKRGN